MLQLIYIHYLGKNAELEHQYLLYFVPSNMELCNDNWKENVSGLFNDVFQPNSSNTIAYHWTTSIPLGIINQNLCLGMKHAIDNIVALAWEDISDYEEYPEDGRVVLYYGMDIETVREILSSKNGKFEKQ
jgi:hypothetical protein